MISYFYVVSIERGRKKPAFFHFLVIQIIIHNVHFSFVFFKKNSPSQKLQFNHLFILKDKYKLKYFLPAFSVTVTLLLCYSVTLSLFSSVTVLLCYLVTLLLCYSVTLLQGRNEVYGIRDQRQKMRRDQGSQSQAVRFGSVVLRGGQGSSFPRENQIS